MSTLLYVRDVAPYRDAEGRARVAGVHQSLSSAATALEEVAGLCGLGFACARRASDVASEQLAAARVLALFTIGETPWTAEQRTTVERRVAAGELALVGIHSAADSAATWRRFGELVGGRFAGHPLTGELPIAVLDAGHPATHHVPSPWRFEEELYLFDGLVADARVLLGVRLDELPGGVRELVGERPGRTAAVGDRATLPLAWCIERGAMRSFYTALGHFVAAYEDPIYLEHLHGGVRWALGEAGGTDGAG